MLDNKRGVWGLGIVGQSAIRYLYKHGHEIGVLDKKILTNQEHIFLKEHGAKYFDSFQEKDFFKTYHTIIRSPGIDIRPYESLSNTFLSELDLFYEAFKKPIIGITGTIGKTSVTHLLSSLLMHKGLRIAVGGNIGTGVLDLIEKNADKAVIELSSFQLEQIRHFDAQLAIITNLFPNHLDRHQTVDAYYRAKYNLLYYQNKHHSALVSASLYDRLMLEPAMTEKRIAFFNTQKPRGISSGRHVLYYFDASGRLCKEENGKIYTLIESSKIPLLSFKTNWLIIGAALDMLGYEIPDFNAIALEIPAHRLQHVGTVDNIAFYNDSKSTIPEATLAAIKELENKPIILLVGGIGKGIDRDPFIKKLAGRVKSLHCFGVEAESLFSYAQKYKLTATKHSSLDDAFKASVENAKAHDQILLSPSGSSLDLFKNYEERGIAFEKLVKVYSNRNQI